MQPKPARRRPARPAPAVRRWPGGPGRPLGQVLVGVVGVDVGDQTDAGRAEQIADPWAKAGVSRQICPPRMWTLEPPVTRQAEESGCSGMCSRYRSAWSRSVVAVFPQQRVGLRPGQAYPHAGQVQFGQQFGCGHVLQHRGGLCGAVGDPHVCRIAGGVHQRGGPSAAGLELAVLGRPRRRGGQRFVPQPLHAVTVQRLEVADLPGQAGQGTKMGVALLQGRVGSS